MTTFPVLMYVDGGLRAAAVQRDHDSNVVLVVPVYSQTGHRAHAIIIETPELIRLGAAPKAELDRFEEWMKWVPTRLYPLSQKGVGSRITRF